MRELVKELREMVQTYVIQLDNMIVRIEATSYEDAIDRFGSQMGLGEKEIADLKAKMEPEKL